ncbi:MAG: radical SAM protein [Desulfatibacillaceae bacterium]
MANLSLTTLCNAACPTCFAAPVLGRGAPLHMDAPTVDRALAFVGAAQKEVRFLGGEPTLHPDFSGVLDKALARGLAVTVFTNGNIPAPALERLCDAPESVLVLVNTTAHPAAGNLAEVLARLGSRAMAGANIADRASDPGGLLELVDRFGLARTVRLGLAHPVAGGHNRYLHPREYREIGDMVAGFAVRARERGVAVDLDCGFVPCMFGEEGLEALGMSAADVGMRCNPLPDVLPDGSVAPCYALAPRDRLPMDGLPDADRARSLFASRLAGLRRVGIYPECGACRYRERGECAGGCLGAALDRLRGSSTARLHEPVSGPGPAVETGERPDGEALASPAGKPWALPYIDQPMSFWESLAGDVGEAVGEVYFPLPGGIVGSGRPPQPETRLTEFLREAPFGLGVVVNPVVLPGSLEQSARHIMRALAHLHEAYGLASVTVANPSLAAMVRDSLPDVRVVASILMDVALPQTAMCLRGACDVLVPASRVCRNLAALEALAAAWGGPVRFIVNEGCLPGCPYRTQHFYEMANGAGAPQSLCGGILARRPWLRLTGSWILPQHLHLYDAVAGEWKLSGRVTLQDPEQYRRVVSAYIRREPLLPHEIGGGPASVDRPVLVDERFFRHTLACGGACHECSLCRDLWEAAVRSE